MIGILVPLLQRLAVFLCFILCFALAGLAGTSSAFARAENGVLDLRQTAPGTVRTTLDGEWLFWWGQLYSPGEVLQNLATAGRHEIPHVWNGHVLPGGKIATGEGAATLFLRILMPEDRRALSGLMMPEVNSAYQMWINGTLVQRVGMPGLTAETEHSQFRQAVVALPDASEIEIVLQVSNHMHFEGGVTRSLVVEPLGSLIKKNDTRVGISLILTGALLIMTLYLLIFFLQRPEPEYILFSLLTTLALIRAVSVARLPLYIWPDMSQYGLLLRAEYFSMFMFPSLYVMFLERIFPEEMVRWLNRSILAVAVAFGLFSLVGSPYFFTQARDPYQLFLLASLIYAIGSVILATVRKREGAAWVMASVLILGLGILNDSLHYQRVIDSTDLFPAAFVLFMLGHAVVLGSRMNRAFNAVELLSRHLSELNRSLERRVAEATRDVRESNDRMRVILETVPEGVLTVTEDSRIETFSAGAEVLFGWSADEILGHSALELAAGVWADKFQKALGLYRNGTEPTFTGAGEFEAEGLRKDGSVLPILLSINAALLNGRTVFVVTVRDISQRRQQEEDRRARQKALEAMDQKLVEAERLALLGHYEFFPNRMETHWSEGLERIWGFRPGQAPRNFLDFLDLVHPADRDRQRALMEDPTWNATTQDIRVVRPDGEVRYIHFRGYRDRDRNGGIVREFGINQDITDRHRAEEELHAAMRDAEAAAEIKSEVLTTVSHEIRTPMNGILGMVQLLLGTRLSTEQREYVDTINYSGGALLTILNDILDLSRLEEGRLTLEETEFDLQRLVRSVTDLMTPRASAKGLAVRCVFGSGVPEAVIGDPTRLRQVLLNLVSNAVKFTEQGEVTVVAEAVEQTEDTVRLRFEVRDTGIGMTDEVRTRLFSRFMQADASVARVYGGSGLGLAICRRITDLMDGDIDVESQPGKGSVFRLVLPFKLIRKSVSADVSGAVPSPRRVLLVEDVAVNRHVAAAILKRDGHTVDMAETGAEAVSMATATDYDIILMDIRLPDFDGVEATRRIRLLADPIKASVPIVALTANVFGDDVKTYRAAGMDGVVAKPIQVDRMRATMSEVLDDLETLDDDLPEAVDELEVIPAASAPAPVDSLSLVDHDFITERLNSLGHETFTMILGLGRRGVLAAAADLAKAWADGDLATLGREAHKLAGAASNFGFMALMSQGRRIEMLVAAENYDEARALAGDVPDLVMNTMTALDSWLSAYHLRLNAE